jgi:hypothetical protein
MADLGNRAQLLVDKHVKFIVGFAQVRVCHLLRCMNVRSYALWSLQSAEDCGLCYQNGAHGEHYLVQQNNTFEYFATEHFRLSGVYWGVTALALLGCLDAIDGGIAAQPQAWTLD